MKKITPALFNDVSKLLARHIVLKDLTRPLDGTGINAKSDKYVHVVATNKDELSINVLRQAMLLCHFPNFHDNSDRCRTHITLLVPQADPQKLSDLKKQLTAEDAWGNLLHHCHHTIHMENGKVVSTSEGEKTFIDVEVDIIGLREKNADAYLSHFVPDDKALVTVFHTEGDLSEQTLEKLNKTCLQVYCLPQLEPKSENVVARLHGKEIIKDELDFTDEECFMSQITSAAYTISKDRCNEVIRKDISDNEAFNIAIKHFKYLLRKTPVKHIRKEWEKKEPSKQEELLQLSNFYCTDCFEYKLCSLVVEEKNKDNDNPPSILSIALEFIWNMAYSIFSRGIKYKEMHDAVTKNISDLARTEHARWNVEKLLVGFSPCTPQQRETIYEAPTLTEREEEGNKLKKAKQNPAHFDLCDYGTLCCKHNISRRYDVFLMLAMPEIIARCRPKKLPERIKEVTSHMREALEQRKRAIAANRGTEADSK